MSDSTNVSNGKRTITIKGVAFEYVERYRVSADANTIERRNGNGEWAVVTEELPMLVSRVTQDMSQNLGNNFRPTVQAALDAAGVADGSGLSADALAQLHAGFAEEVSEYEFGGAGGPRGPRDPVKKMTMNYLVNTIRAKAAEKGIVNWTDAQVVEKAESAYKANPDKYRAQAQAAAKAAARKQDDELDAVMAA